VLDWAKAAFGDSEKEDDPYRREMKGLDWGRLYREYGDKELDVPVLRNQVNELMRNDNNEIGSLSGIYEYVLSDNEKHLNLRQYNDSEKRAMYEQQDGICPLCDGEFKINQMEGDHITPWSEGGKTTLENGQMLCRDCNRRKGAK
jgi:5-methylcytosine-specific restriction endonuclease McrA